MTSPGTYAKRQRARRRHQRSWRYKIALFTSRGERFYIDDVGPAPDPELCARLFRSFPLIDDR